MVLGNIPWLSLLQPQQLQEGKCHGCENTDLVTGLRVRGETGLMSSSSPPTIIPLCLLAH